MSKHLDLVILGFLFLSVVCDAGQNACATVAFGFRTMRLTPADGLVWIRSRPGKAVRRCDVAIRDGLLVSPGEDMAHGRFWPLVEHTDPPTLNPIPYWIDPALPEAQARTVREAVAAYTACSFRFRESAEREEVKITFGPSHLPDSSVPCYAGNFGRVTGPRWSDSDPVPNYVGLTAACKTSQVVHAIGHVLALFHNGLGGM